MFQCYPLLDYLMVSNTPVGDDAHSSRVFNGYVPAETPRLSNGYVPAESSRISNGNDPAPKDTVSTVTRSGRIVKPPQRLNF